MSEGFGKIHESIFGSTIMEETFIPKKPISIASIFALLLGACNAEGVIDMTLEALARKFNMDVEDLQYVLDRLMMPDLRGSRSQEMDGRRLALIDPENRDWGWFIVNHQKYRQQRTAEDRRAYQKEFQKKAREIAKGKNPEIEQWFDVWWKIYPARNGIKAGKQDALLQFVRIIQSEEDFQHLLKATERYKAVIGEWAKDGERFLKNEYWRDFIPQPKEPEKPEAPLRIKDKEGKVWEMVGSEWVEVKA
jgi:hypothetical protein